MSKVDYETHGSTALHQDLIKAFTKAVTKEFPLVTIIPYTVGLFRDYETAERTIRAGVAGVPDLIVVLSTGGVIFLDAKTGKATFNKNQRMFKNRLLISTGTDRVFKLKNVEMGLDIIRGFEK